MLRNFLYQILASLVMVGAITVSYGQTYNMSNGSATTCSGTFYDSGGSGGSYSSSESFVYTFTPSSAGSMIQLDFTAFSIETCCDDFMIYNGGSTASPLIGTYTSSPGTITASNSTGELTIEWISDGSVTDTGWEATISCIAVITHTSGSTTTCSGVYSDPQGLSDYTDFNGSQTFTICSGTTDILQIDFTEFETRENNDNLAIYDGPNTGSPLIGTYATTNSPGTVTSTGTCLTFVWTTDGNGAGRPGWLATIACTQPIPDDCSSAIDLSTISSPYSGSTTGATNSFTSCASGTSGDNIFYIDVPVGSTLTIGQNSNNYDSYHSVYYGGACPGSTQIACLDGSETTPIVWQNCTGSTQTVYWIQDGYLGAEGNYELAWSIAAGSCPVPPSNDLCTGATSLPCGTTNMNGTTVNSTSVSDPASCASSYGVWYTFTGDGNPTTISTDAASGFDQEMVISSGSCGSLTNIACEDGSSSGGIENYSFTTVNGTDYFVYVAYYSTSGSSSSTGDFTISRTCSTAPSNDDCANAVSLPCATSNLAGSTVGTTSATHGTGCTLSDYGVWYTFTGDGNLNIITVDPAAGFDVEVAVASGSCASLTNVNCEDGGGSGTAEANAFTSVNGTTYYAYVAYYSSSGTSSDVGDFTISRDCVTPPANDECSGAISLTVNPDQTCVTSTSGTITGATASADANSCSGTADDDVWFSFVATHTTHYIDLSNITGSVTDMYNSVYTGTCGSLGAAIDCSDPNSNTVTGLTIGQTYYVRVYTYTSTGGQNVDFDICVTSPNPPPSNDDCPNAIALTMNGPICVTTTSSYTENATQSMAGCTGTADDDVWFSFVATATTHDLSLLNAQGTTDLVHEVFSGTCGSLTSISCSDPNTSTVSGLTVGDTYYVRVYTYSSTGTNTGFEICITGPCTADPAPTCNLDYTMSSISHSPYSYTTGTILSFSDDRFADSYSSIGFTFCFDGINYNELLVSSNGYVSFPHCLTTIPDGNFSTSGYSPYSISAAIPNNTDAPTNSIMLWHDIDPSVSGTIRTQTHGTAPNRVFVVKYYDVAMYDCTTLRFNGQIMLYETTNDIEIHVTEKTTCSTWNGSDAILGLNNYDGTIAVTDAGHNYPTDWTETNTAYKFGFNCPACTITLPIDLLSFDGYPASEMNVLEWTTASEHNSDKFVIEKSLNGVEFNEIGEIASAGESNNRVDYVYNDTKIQGQSKCYYRLKQMDNNSDIYYSDIVVIKRNFSGLDMNIVPNPNQGEFVLNITSFNNSNVRIEMYDYSGRIIEKRELQITKGKSSLDYNIADLNAGIYFIHISDEFGNSTFKKVVKK